jgi:hypothetical protein
MMSMLIFCQICHVSNPTEDNLSLISDWLREVVTANLRDIPIDIIEKMVDSAVPSLNLPFTSMILDEIEYLPDYIILSFLKTRKFSAKIPTILQTIDVIIDKLERINRYETIIKIAYANRNKTHKYDNMKIDLATVIDLIAEYDKP